MNDFISENKNTAGGCLLTYAIKIFLIVAVAELAIYLLSAVTGKDIGVSELINSILRILIIAAGLFLLSRKKQPELLDKDSLNAETNPDAVDDHDPNQWPNIDALTRTSNERGLTVSILELMALADRYGHKLSIGMIKVDGIDAMQKSAADDAMINMAGLITESLRLPDRIGRFRENIFMVLLPESDIEGAAIVANRLRANLEQNKTEAHTDQVSVWIGMTEFHRGEDLQSLLDRVEAAADQSRNEENGVFIKIA